MVCQILREEQDDKWIPILRFLFLADDPIAFANRIANSMNERKKQKLDYDFCFILNQCQ
jgi:hypothetical protein